MPEDMTPPQAGSGRPVNVDSTGKPMPLTTRAITRGLLGGADAQQSPRGSRVSVVVCFKRDLTPTAERAVTVSNFSTCLRSTALGGIGGGSVQLARQINDIASDDRLRAGITIKENDWVALCSDSRAVPLVSRGVDWGQTRTYYLTLIGPDWMQSSTRQPDKLVAWARA